MTPDYEKFIETGDLPASMSARSKILDICRNQILQFQNITPQNMSETRTIHRRNPHTGENVILHSQKELSEFNQSISQNPVPINHAPSDGSENLTSAEIAQLNAEAAARRGVKIFNKNSPIFNNAAPVSPAPAKPTASAPSGVVHRAQLPAAVAPAATGLVTAAQFATTRPTMVYSEFSKLTPADKSRFVTQSKGKVIDDPQPAKPHRKNGQLTREGFNHLSPAAKAAHCKAKLPILD